MAFDELKEDLIGAEANMRSYIATSDEYLRLKIFKVIMHHITGITKVLLMGIGFVFALLFLSFAACLALSEQFDSYYSGFIIVGGFYAILGIVIYVFREKLNAPILKKFSNYYFD